MSISLVSAILRTKSFINDLYFQFLLRQAFADDEASTRLLQILLFLLLSTTSLVFILCAIRSSFTLSIHFFGCLPLLLVPYTCPYSATTCSLFPSILVTCPSHVSLMIYIKKIFILSHCEICGKTQTHKLSSKLKYNPSTWPAVG